MKRVLPFILVLFLPIAVFAQSAQTPQSAQTRLLKQLGLNDGQVSQVLDIQGKTMTTARADVAQLRLLRAQLDKALLPASPDMTAVNGIIAQIGQTRVDMQKALVAARVQLRQIIGDDNFRLSMRHVRQHFGMNMRRGMRGPGFGGGMMDGDPMSSGPMGGRGPGGGSDWTQGS
jgi:hypothetical protein